MDLSLVAAAQSRKQCTRSNSTIVRGLEIRTAPRQLSLGGISCAMADAGRVVDAKLCRVGTTEFSAIDGCAKIQGIGLGGAT